MGLMANIPVIEAANALAFAKGIAIAFGDAESAAHAVYLTTGNGRLAQRVEIAMKRSESKYAPA